MTTLSLFNGMSCGKMALDLVGISGQYYYSEIDKYGNQLTSALYPNAIPLGDVRDIDFSKLPKIDLLIGGSPCQSFSFAGKRKGMVTKCEIEILSLEQYLELKNSGFEFEGQSYLFWEFVRILNEVKPKYFLLENVIMVEKWRKVLSQNVGINPIRINSALVSAQNRDRYYWTNIYAEKQGLFGDLKCMIPQPEDKGILLRNILESDVPEKYFLSEKLIKGFINHTIKKQSDGCGFKFEPQDGSKKGKAVTTKPGTRCDDNYVCTLSTQEHATISINKSTPLTSAMGMGGGHVPMIKKREVRQLSDNNKSNGGTQPYQQDRIYDVSEIAPALCKDKSDLIIHNTMPRSSKSGKGGTGHLSRNDGKTYCLDTGQTNAVELNQSIRRLTPKECLRLQTVPEHLIDKILNLGISDTQIYKMAGNGWTIATIEHILKHIHLCR